LSQNTGLFAKINFFQDKRNRNKIKKYIEFFISFYDYPSIFGAKAIVIDNAIDVSSVKYTGDKAEALNEVNIIGVALIVNIHGYDRIIEGLKNYYAEPENTKNVNFYIIGDGPEAPRLKALVEKYQLTEHVFFTGVKKGKELDELFEKSNVAVASLAAHRRGAKTTSELKVKEYCTRGIPFIATSTDKSLPENPKFVKIFSADESPVDIRKVVEFVEICNADADLSKYMRQFAEENLTWERQLKKVIEALEN
jgi:glycosyltransferase involved in cell wall biosynthesis